MEEFKMQNSMNWKVKVYLLNSSGNWDDYGTGMLQLSREMNVNTEIEEEYLIVKSRDEFPPNV